MANLVQPMHVHASRFDELTPVLIDKEIYTGATGVRELVIASTSHSTTSTQFTQKIPDDCVIDRTFLLRTQVQVTLTAPAPTAVAGYTSTITDLSGLALAAYPLSRVMTNLAINFNNSGDSKAPWVYAAATRRIGDNTDDMRFNSLCPTMEDVYASIRTSEIASGCAVNADGSPNAAALSSSSSSGPFGYSNSGDHYLPPRSMFQPISIVQTQAPTVSTATAAGLPEQITVTYQVTEPLSFPWLNKDVENDGTLARISQVDVQIGWHSSLQGLFTAGLDMIKSSVYNTSNTPPTLVSIAGCTVVGVTWPVNSQAQLLMRQLTPTVAIPPVVKYTYNDFKQYTSTTPLTLTNAGQTGQLILNSVRLNQVPNRIILFAHRTNQIADASSTDCYLRINSLVINTNGTNASFSNATPEQLYQMSVRNGLNMSWQDWYNNVGSIVVIDVRKADIGGLVADVLTPVNIDITVNATNIQYTSFIRGKNALDTAFVNTGGNAPALAANDQSWQLVALFMQEYEMELDAQQCVRIGGIDENVVSTATEFPPMPDKGGMRSMHARNRGGSFWGSIKNGFLKPLWNDVIKPVGSELWNVAKPVLGSLAQKGVNAGLARVGLAQGNTGGVALGAGHSKYSRRGLPMY